MKRIFHFFNANQQFILQTGLGLFFVALGIYFIRHERAELHEVQAVLQRADMAWIIAGSALILAYVVLQGMMYQYSFRAIRERIQLWTGVMLFLKRNVVSIFLPAGMLTNMLFFNREVEQKEQVGKTQIYFASTIFSVCSIGSAILAGLPALLWLFWKSRLSGEMALGFALTAALLGVLIWATFSFQHRGWFYHMLEKRMPSLIQVLEELRSQSIDQRQLLKVLLLSCGIEATGIAHLYISISALGGQATLEAAVIGYAVVLLLLMSSPFLRGIGAIEVVLTYSLTLFGFSTVSAISMAFLFRFFEFWAVLALGVLAFLAQRDNLLLRLFPALLLFVLGLVNILSALTPALPWRLEQLQNFLPLDAIHASNWLVLFSGVIMLAVAVYLQRGMRNAWLLAVGLSALSLITHLGKGFDWEEATIALLTLFVLIYQRKAYYIRSDLQRIRNTWLPGLTAIGAVWLFGTLAFFWLDEHHFHANFTLLDSFRETVTTFFLLNVDLTPATRFAGEFLVGMKTLGGVTIGLSAWLFLRPFIWQENVSSEEARQKASILVEKYGHSPLDYFKTYADKLYWFSEDGGAFVSFRATSSYAVVLENPVCSPEKLVEVIRKFDQYCRDQGLRTIYYRIPESSQEAYKLAGKKLLPVGEEAVLHLETFSLKGKDKMALRNAVNKLTKGGYVFRISLPPQKDGFLQQLRAVSDSWLQDTERTELAFSQGWFDEKELKEQTIATVENEEGKIVSFTNLIPEHGPGDANFDLVRKTADAPNGAMDFLFISLFQYLQEKGCRSVNLGMAPLSGIENPENLQEQLIKLAYERLRRFAHYRSLRSFKEKFDPEWQPNYLAYEAMFDLIYFPAALEEVFKV